MPMEASCSSQASGSSQGAEGGSSNTQPVYEIYLICGMQKKLAELVS